MVSFSFLLIFSADYYNTALRFLEGLIIQIMLMRSIGNDDITIMMGRL